MQRRLVLSAASVTLLAATTLLGACATQQHQAADVAVKTGGATASAVGETASGVGGAVQAPLRDVNVVHEEIPIVLKRAVAGPYDLAGVETCGDVLKQVGDLDLALGPDIDTPKDDSAKRADNYSKGASFAAQAALDAVKDTAEGVIPMKTWVRKLSGAARAEQQVKDAIRAGDVRRGFLKGVGLKLNCAWPAAPLGFEPKPAIAPASAAPSPTQNRHRRTRTVQVPPPPSSIAQGPS